VELDARLDEGENHSLYGSMLITSSTYSSLCRRFVDGDASSTSETSPRARRSMNSRRSHSRSRFAASYAASTACRYASIVSWYQWAGRPPGGQDGRCVRGGRRYHLRPCRSPRWPFGGRANRTGGYPYAVRNVPSRKQRLRGQADGMARIPRRRPSIHYITNESVAATWSALPRTIATRVRDR